jgi:hypothetical protein
LARFLLPFLAAVLAVFCAGFLSAFLGGAMGASRWKEEEEGSGDGGRRAAGEPAGGFEPALRRSHPRNGERSLARQAKLAYWPAGGTASAATQNALRLARRAARAIPAPFLLLPPTHLSQQCLAAARERPPRRL